MADELLQPLGQGRRRRLPKLSLFSVTLGLALILALAILGWVAAVEDPLGGEPVAIAAIGKPGPEADGAAAKPPTGPWARLANEPAAAPAPEPSAAPPAPAPEQPVIEPGPPAGASPPGAGPVPASDPTRMLTLSPAPDPRLVERSRQGNLPRIADDGSRPADVYARPVVHLAGSTVGRVVVVVGGVGLSARTTRAAIEELPGAVTLAFAPYGDGLVRAAASARQNGHEIMLQSPMEPFDYPDNDPGPKTLLANGSKEQNLDKLHWQMSRFAGYTGLLNYMGARFTSTEAALTPMLYELKKRGLFYLDDGSSPRSLAPAIAGGLGLPALRANLVLDATPARDEIDAKLAELEKLALRGGTAVGVASALPVSIERIAAWSRTLRSRGIELVPISAAMPRAGS